MDGGRPRRQSVSETGTGVVGVENEPTRYTTLYPAPETGLITQTIWPASVTTVMKSGHTIHTCIHIHIIHTTRTRSNEIRKHHYSISAIQPHTV